MIDPSADTIALARRPAEVARRAMCVSIVAVRARGLEREVTLDLVRKLDLEDDLTPGEKAFLGASRPEDRELARMSWRDEAFHALMWALGRCELGPPLPVNPRAVVQAVVGFHPGFPEQATLRPSGQIVDAVRDAHVHVEEIRSAYLACEDAPAHLHPKVVRERWRALQWLAGDPDWDRASIA